MRAYEPAFFDRKKGEPASRANARKRARGFVWGFYALGFLGHGKGLRRERPGVRSLQCSAKSRREAHAPAGDSRCGRLGAQLAHPSLRNAGKSSPGLSTVGLDAIRRRRGRRSPAPNPPAQTMPRAGQESSRELRESASCLTFFVGHTNTVSARARSGNPADHASVRVMVAPPYGL